LRCICRIRRAQTASGARTGRAASACGARTGRARSAISPEYDQWKRAADKLAIALGGCRHLKRIDGKFEALIILKRQRGDLDNRVKGVLDWAQSRELIADDKYCERLTVTWGEAPYGCRLILRGVA
jgi:Holliday junction resolvase RusA-like endonuclease